MAISATFSAFGTTLPPIPTPTVMTSYYTRLYFHAIEGSGSSCAEAKSDALNTFYQWSNTIPLTGTLVTPAEVVPGTCECGIFEGERKYSCLGSYVQELSVSIDLNKTLSGSIHGPSLNESPTFAIAGSGLECNEALYDARTQMYEMLEKQSTAYEFNELQNLSCECRNELDPTSRCIAGVEAFYRDIHP